MHNSYKILFGNIIGGHDPEAKIIDFELKFSKNHEKYNFGNEKMKKSNVRLSETLFLDM